MNSNHYAFAKGGSDTVTDTTAQSGRTWFAMQVVADAVVASMTFATDKFGNDIHASDWTTLGTIPAGITLYGEFTALTLTSGKVVLYRK